MKVDELDNNQSIKMVDLTSTIGSVNSMSGKKMKVVFK